MHVFDPDEQPAARRQGMLSQLITPRPIAMISTVDEAGVANVAPYSYVMPVTGDPMLLAVTMGAHREAGGAPKDTWTNTERSGEFVVNVTAGAMAPHIETVAMEFPPEVDEADVVGWSLVPSVKVAPPSIAESPAHLECRVHEVVALGAQSEVFSAVNVVFAEVVCVTLSEAICGDDLRVDATELETIGRLGFPWFNRSSEPTMFELPRVPYAEWSSSGAARAPETGG